MRMTPIQSKINAVKSRILQIETSDMFSPEEKQKLLKCNEIELECLENQKNEPETRNDLEVRQGWKRAAASGTIR